MTTMYGPHQDHPSSVKLKISTKDDLGRFLREMLPTFVETVDPRESGVLDSLIAADLLTDTDNESMSGKDVRTRKDQARKLWVLLNKLSVEDFLSKVAPELCSKFPHVIPKGYVMTSSTVVDIDDVTDDDLLLKQASTYSGACVVHVIKSRVRVLSMADMLYHGGFLDLTTYETMVSGDCETEAVWTAIFEAFTDRRGEELETLKQALEKLLTKHRLPVPNDLSDVMARGLPCTCAHPEICPPKASVGELREVDRWLSQSRFSLARSSGSSRTKEETSSIGPTSTPTTTRHADSLSLSSTASDSSTSSGTSTLVAVPVSTQTPSGNPPSPPGTFPEDSGAERDCTAQQSPGQARVSEETFVNERSRPSFVCDTGNEDAAISFDDVTCDKGNEGTSFDDDVTRRMPEAYRYSDGENVMRKENSFVTGRANSGYENRMKLQYFDKERRLPKMRTVNGRAWWLQLKRTCWKVLGFLKDCSIGMGLCSLAVLSFWIVVVLAFVFFWYTGPYIGKAFTACTGLFGVK